MTLTRKQMVFLRGKAHGLTPVVSVGNNGLTPAVMTEIEIALAHHELVKVKLAVDDRDVRRQMVARIIDATGGELVQQIGKIAVFYRQGEKTRVTLPV